MFNSRYMSFHHFPKVIGDFITTTNSFMGEDYGNSINVSFLTESEPLTDLWHSCG